MNIATQPPNASTIEVRSIDYIPLDERHGRVRDQFTFWFANNANIFPVVLGGVTIFLGLTFVWACVAIVLGVVIGQCLVGFHAIQGPRLGLPQMLQSRAQFGFYGAVLVFAASIVLDFGFFAAQLVIQADAMNLLIPGISVPGVDRPARRPGPGPHHLRLRPDPPLAAMDDLAARGDVRGDDRAGDDRQRPGRRGGRPHGPHLRCVHGRHRPVRDRHGQLGAVRLGLLALPTTDGQLGSHVLGGGPRAPPFRRSSAASSGPT